MNACKLLKSISEQTIRVGFPSLHFEYIYLFNGRWGKIPFIRENYIPSLYSYLYQSSRLYTISGVQLVLRWFQDDYVSCRGRRACITTPVWSTTHWNLSEVHHVTKRKYEVDNFGLAHHVIKSWSLRIWCVNTVSWRRPLIRQWVVIKIIYYYIC